MEKIKTYVEETIAPLLQGDGGWIEFEEYKDGIMTVIFRGECSKCLILHRCSAWIEEKIKEDLGVDVKLNGIRKKPYFQDV